MNSGYWHYAGLACAWAVSGAWCLRVYGALRHVPELPDLSLPKFDRAPATMPGLTVVVPACNEGAHIAATLESLVAQDYAWLQIIAVNDRSTDDTGAIVDAFAARWPKRVRAIHIRELPAGWLGKTNALHVAVQESQSEYLLFTDADVRFAPQVLRRALAYAEQSGAAHVVVGPSPEIRSLGEGVVLGFLPVLGLLASRPWRVADPKAKRDIFGVGAFNLLRRDALDALGGLEPQRLAIVEDMTLAHRVKQAELSQRMVLGPGMVRLHWASGASGIVRVTTKNLFATVNFQPLLMLIACGGIGALFLLPFVGLTRPLLWLPSLLMIVATLLAYRAMRRAASISAHYAWAYPAGALIIIWAMLHSMATVLVNGGVMWRGTFYPLRELRKHNATLR